MFWVAENPQQWPAVPKWMSYSTLMAIESCPRRWSLLSAEYPNIWERVGYPKVPMPSLIEGKIIHMAIETIVRTFLYRGCYSIIDPKSFEILKELGGVTTIIKKCITKSLEVYKENPRTEFILDQLTKNIITKIPYIRNNIQRLLSRVQLFPEKETIRVSTVDLDKEKIKKISKGSFSEIKVKVPEMGWVGVIDLLTLNTEFCEIRDFKTGVNKPEHELQIKIYSLLWMKDTNRNVSGKLPSKLILSYPNYDVEVPVPDIDSLRDLEYEIMSRTQKSFKAIRKVPPTAKPTNENCKYCSVRHLCNDYWEYIKPVASESKPVTKQFIDLEINLTKQHGPKSWYAVVESCPIISRESRILLRCNNAPFILKKRQRIRLLNVIINISKSDYYDDEKLYRIATSVMNTEMYLVM